MIVLNVDQNTDEWSDYRIGIPTASDFSKLVTSSGEPSKSMADYAIVLAGNRFAGRSLDAWGGNYHTERGHEIEPEAKDWYSFSTGVEVESIGFVMDDDKQWGCSPDGYVGEGLIEIKCLSAKEHIKALLYYKKHEKCPTTYVPQTQGQMLICERPWNDLLFYHPHLPKLIIRQYPIKKVFEGLKSQLIRVIEERDRILKELENL